MSTIHSWSASQINQKFRHIFKKSRVPTLHVRKVFLTDYQSTILYENIELHMFVSNLVEVYVHMWTNFKGCQSVYVWYKFSGLPVLWIIKKDQNFSGLPLLLLIKKRTKQDTNRDSKMGLL